MSSETPVLSGTITLGPVSPTLTQSPAITWTDAVSTPVASSYQLAIGTTVGATNVVAWQDVGTSSTYTFSGLALTDGVTYYVSLRAVGSNGLPGNAITHSSGWMAIGSPFSISAINDDIAFPSVTDTPPISWTYPGTLVATSFGFQFQIAIGTTAGGTNIVNWTSTGTAPSWSTTGLILTLGTRYYATVRIVSSTGTVYSTINGDGWIPVSTVTSIARYSTAPNWNDYVKASATSTACDVMVDVGYYTCIHGGEKRRVNYAAAANCTNYSIADELDAFYWACDETGGAGNVFFYTRGLKKNKGLSDLLNATSWKSERVVISNSGTPVAASVRTEWWTNTIAALPTITTAGATASLSANTIYTVTTNQTILGGYTVPSSTVKIGIVVFPGYVLTMGATTPVATELLNPILGNFYWIEGSYAAASPSAIVYSFIGNSSAFAVIRRAEFTGFINGLGDGNSLFSSSLISQVRFVKNSADGIKVKGSYNILADIIATQNGDDGVDVGDLGGPHVLQNIIVSHNGGDGLDIWSVVDAVALGVTSISNGTQGIYFASDNRITLNNAYSSGNTNFGYRSDTNTRPTVSQAIFDSIRSNNVTTGKYTGNLIMPAANGCTITGGPSPGLVTTTCANTGSSDATLSVVANVGNNSFLGEVTTNDTKNTSDTFGSQNYVDISDWINFDFFTRSWVRDILFPLAGSAGRCTTGICRIFDFRLKPADTHLRNTVNASTASAAFVNGAACPAQLHGNMTFTDVHTSPRTYLRHAMEILGSGGNNNGLCESNESCLYLPNFGGYQGTGDFWSNRCTFSNGTVTGVSMYAYPEN